jgi:hypothetical protein
MVVWSVCAVAALLAAITLLRLPSDAAVTDETKPAPVAA